MEGAAPVKSSMPMGSVSRRQNYGGNLLAISMGAAKRVFPSPVVSQLLCVKQTRTGALSNTKESLNSSIGDNDTGIGGQCQMQAPAAQVPSWSNEQWARNKSARHETT